MWFSRDETNNAWSYDLGYDRRGRPSTTVFNTTTTTLGYNDADQLTREANSGWTLAGLTLTLGYDGYLRRTNAVFKQGTTAMTANGFTYDTASRLVSVLDSVGVGTVSAVYTPLANTPLQGQVVMKNNTSPVMQTARQYDGAGRLLEVRTTASTGGLAVSGGKTVGPNGSTAFVAPAAEIFTPDLDGNLIQDARWVYTWDAENRLISMQSQTSVPDAQKRRLVFEYDWQSRRTGKKVFVYSGGAYPASPNSYIRFLYQGWNLVRELDGNNANATLRSYTWGLDLSGSPQGAGGVGGLLAINDAENGQHFAAYDGNGNIMTLNLAFDGAETARYEYGPFGETIRTKGAMSKVNPFRFSTKFCDEESGLACYGYRYYDSRPGRWLGRDPIEKAGGKCLHAFINNSPENAYDALGGYV